ncbi:MAG TPA: branched-chain amino acid ABC transporter substrate-binding protein, partial [Actinobacteria bacterium]|nr:branched-chain amino acid ABC transporter substrate-binding protein [Actinomycetota bacterium]
MRKRLPFLGVVVAFALLAAACGGGTGGTTTTAGEQTTTTKAQEPGTTAPPAEEKPEPGPLGAVEVAPGEDIQIRSLEAISGDVAFLGIPNDRATEIAIEDFGPIAGHAVTRGTPLDDLCSAEGGQAGAQQIVSDASVVGVIGTSCSGAAVAAAPLISEAGMVMISPSNTSPALTSDLKGNPGTDWHEGYYRTAHNDLFQGKAVALFVYEELGLKKAAAIHDGDPYTNGLATAFKDAFEELGGEVVAFTAVNKGDTDMVPVLTEVAAAGPEVIFFPIFMPEGGFIAQQVRGVSGLEEVTLIAADGLLADNFMELPESEGVYFSGPDLRFGDNKSATGVSADDFLAKYEEKYGEQPTAAFWAHSYDATVLLLTAIQD